jgi:hypothetical protein
LQKALITDRHTIKFGCFPILCINGPRVQFDLPAFHFLEKPYIKSFLRIGRPDLWLRHSLPVWLFVERSTGNSGVSCDHRWHFSVSPLFVHIFGKE